MTDAGLLGELIGFPSVSSRPNIDLVDFLCNQLDQPGITLSRRPTGVEGKLNLVATAGPAASAGEGLVLSGHLDVVPPGDAWSTHPFTLVRRGDNWHGRGTADMKGFLALAVNRFARAARRDLRAPVALLLSCDEEVGTLGARHLVQHWSPDELLPRATIIGEPTSLGVVHAHKGHLRLRIRFAGIAAHSGLPHLGRSAIEPAGAGIVALTALRQELASERVPAASAFSEVPFVALNIGRVQGGQAINVIPDACEVDIGLRTLPGVDSSTLIERVGAAVRCAVGTAPFELEVLGESPPMHSSPDAPVHAWLAAALNQRDTRSVSFASDGGWLAHLGLDCVLFGPGSIDVAHKPDEFLPIAEFVRAGEVLDAALAHFVERGV